MQDSEDNLNIPDLIKEFENIDILQRKIKAEFTQSVYAVIIDCYPNFKRFDKLFEALEQYASHIINATGSVIDKDIHYPEYRLKEELDKMQSLVRERKGDERITLFFDEMINESKKIMVKYFPKLINLSGNGFRLLDANALIYGLAFELDFNAINN